MKAKRKTGEKALMVVILILCFPTLCFTRTIKIEDVGITPEFPSDIDSITVSVQGFASNGGSAVRTYQFIRDQTELTLDLYVDMGLIMVPSYWSHDEPIGVLTPDTYTLNVCAYDYLDNSLQDEKTIEFIVTPEPTAFLLLTLGLLGARLRKI